MLRDARSLWLLQAKAKAESASGKMKPPWQMPWPLVIAGHRHRQRGRARADRIERMPMPALARVVRPQHRRAGCCAMASGVMR